MFFPRSRNLCPWRPVRLAALGVFLLAAGMASGQPLEESLYRDLWQTLRARKTLLDDPQLGPLNLGVRVTNRSAVLWGPVPSQELSVRAEQRLRTMFDLVEVRNSLTIIRDDDAVQRAAPEPEAPRFLPDELPPPVPNVPRPPLRQPSTGVALAGIVMPEQTTLIVRSSPLTQAAQGGAGPPAWHLPFLGSIPLPR